MTDSVIALDNQANNASDLNFNLAGIRARDPRALTALFTEMNPCLLRLVMSKGIFADVAEEIVHECWETFFQAIDRFEGRSTIRTFVFGILINKIREHRRRSQKLDYREDSEAVFRGTFTADGWWSRAPADPQRILENSALGQQITSCLDGLTDSQRNAFLLIESEDQMPENVCKILGVSLTNLRVLIFRAKKKLRECLEGYAAVLDQ